MKNYKYILFDLDGTLMESGLGVTNAIIYALDKLNISVDDRTELYKFLGPPLDESFELYYNLSKEQIRQAIDSYREYYEEKGWLEKDIYAGMVELLEALKSKDKTLIVATSKPKFFADKILEHFDISKYFIYISGSNLDETRVHKDEVIGHALEQCRIMDMSSAIMIGDRKHDVLGAAKFGIDSIGVLFGYGDRAELESAGADYIAETVEDIGKLLI